MVLSLLGSMAAGGAQAYAQKRAAEVDRENKMRELIFSREIEDEFSKRVEERRSRAEQAMYERNRADKLSDEETSFGRVLQRDELSHGRTLQRDELQHGRNVALADRRYGQQVSLAQMRQEGRSAVDPKRMAELDKDIRKLDADIYKIERDLNDPMKMHQREASERYLAQLRQERRNKEQALILANDAQQNVQFVRAARQSQEAPAVEQSSPVVRQSSPAVEQREPIRPDPAPRARPLIERPTNDPNQEIRTLQARRQQIIDELATLHNIVGGEGRRVQLEQELDRIERRLGEL